MTHPPLQPAMHRFDTVDLLRGLCILSVILLHAQSTLHYVGVEASRGLPAWLSTLLFQSGGQGVQIFFTISGFLITLTSLRRFGSLGQVVPRAFYRIRFARIAPALLLTLVVLSVMDLRQVPYFHIDPHIASLPRALFAALTFHINWLQAAHGWLPAPWVVLWSLSVEEMFYLFFPLACLLLLRWRVGLQLSALGLAVLVVFPVLMTWPFGPTNPTWNNESYLGGMRNILVGCLFAVLADHCQRHPRLTTRWSLLLLQLAGAAALLFAEIPFLFEAKALLVLRAWMELNAAATLLLALGTGLIMLASVLHPIHGSVWTSPLRWLGRYSYEVYLTHQLVVIGVLSLYPQVRAGNAALWVCLIVILSSGLGLVLSRVVSEPMNRRLRGAPLPAQLRS